MPTEGIGVNSIIPEFDSEFLNGESKQPLEKRAGSILFNAGCIQKDISNRFRSNLDFGTWSSKVQVCLDE